MENKQLTPEQSLEVIRQMVDATRERYERGGGTAFLVFGYTSFIVGVVTLVAAAYTGNPNYSWLWFGIPIIGFPLNFLAQRNRPKEVKTYVDKFISNLWRVIGLVCCLIPLSGLVNWKIFAICVPAETLVLSIGIVLTGLTIRFKLLTVTGFVTMALAFAILIAPHLAGYLFMAVFVVSMIIPGHILNYKGRCLKN